MTRRPPHRRTAAAWGLAAALCVFAPAVRPAVAASPFVPLDHRAYLQVEQWVARGVLAPTLLGARPYAWGRLAAMLERARPVTAADRAAVAALRAEAARHAGPGGGWHVAPAVTGARVEGHPVRYFRPPGAESGGPLVAYDGGTTYAEAAGGDVRLRGEARWRDRLALLLEPRVPFGKVGGGNPGLQEGYVAFGLGAVAVAVGRQPLAWGQAAEGGFLMTPNAAPLPAVRLGLQAPHAFTGRWAPLGTVDFAYILGRLEAERVVSKPYLTGLRLMWMPVPGLEVGLARTILLGGEGRPGVSWSDFVTILGGRNLYGDEDTSDSIAAVDVAWGRPLSGPRALKVYGEFAGEDEAAQLHLPTKPAVRGGLLLAGLGDGGRYALRGEFAATDVFYDHARWGHNAWYAHGVYRSGYTYRGRIIGDPMGSDARTAEVRLTRLAPGGHAEAALGWFATRFSDPDREDHWRGEGIWERDLGPLEVRLTGRLERVVFDDGRDARWQSLLLARVARPFGG